MDKELTKQELVVWSIGNVIHEECESFALNKMID